MSRIQASNMRNILKTNAFTLIEVLIAGAILSAVIFAVLRMSLNNSHQTSLIESEKSRQNIEYSIEQCIRSLWYNAFVNYGSLTGSISFWTNGNECLTGVTSTEITLKNYLWTDEVNPTEVTDFFTIATGSTNLTILLTTETEKNSHTKKILLYK